MHDGLGVFILMVLFVLYCISMFVAMLRNHQQMLAIIVLVIKRLIRSGRRTEGMTQRQGEA